MGGGLSKTVAPVSERGTTDVITGNHVTAHTNTKVLAQTKVQKDQNSVPNYIEQNSIIPHAEQNNIVHPKTRSRTAANDNKNIKSPTDSDSPRRDLEIQSLTSPRDHDPQSESSSALQGPQTARSKTSASETLSELSPRARLSRSQSVTSPGLSQSQSEASPRLTESQSEAISPLSRTQSLISPRVHRPTPKPTPVEVTCGKYVPCLPKETTDKKSKITGCVYLSNGYLVLVDNRNKRVKLFDPDLKCQSFINLEHRPFEICECRGTLYVTIPKEKEIQVISITFPFLCVARKLIPRSIIKTEGECYGITRYKNDLIVSMKFPPPPTDIAEFSWQIFIMTTKGEVKQKIITDSRGRTLFTDAYFITFATGKRELIISEATCDRVRGYNLKRNKKTFNHKIEEPKGAVVDRHNNIYVLGKHASIHWIEPDRKHVHTLLEGSRGRMSSGENITFNTKTNKLLVPRNENKVDIYNLRGKVT